MPTADDLSQIDREMWLRERDKREYAERALMLEAESYQQNLARVEAERDAAQGKFCHLAIQTYCLGAALVICVVRIIVFYLWR